MLRVNGFYGHVRQNDLRSLALFAGFLVAFQLVAAVVLIVPLFMLDIRRLPLLAPIAYLSTYGPFVLAASMILFGVRFRRHVAFVKATAAYREVNRRDEPRLVNIVETLAIAAGLPPPKVGIIETPARNAFACGLTSSSAVVVATRGLIDALDDDELAAVIAHEIAHIQNGDIRLMAAANVLMENLAVVRRRNLLHVDSWWRVLLVIVMPPLLFLVMVTGFVVYVAMTLGRASRLLISSSREFVADAEAVRLTHNPAALISALRKIDGRSTIPDLPLQLDAMMIDGAAVGSTASHPTVLERIAVLKRLSGDMALATTPRRDTRAATPTSGPWGAGAPPDPTPSAAAQPAGLFARVNAGSDRNMFGFTARTKRRLRIVAGCFVALQAVVFVSMLTNSPKPRETAVRQTAAALPDSPNNSPRSMGAASGATAAASAASSGRCYATRAYRVGDRGLRPLGTPDPARIEAALLDPGSSDITIERYLAMRLESVRQVDRAEDKSLDAALLSYVKSRKTLVQTVHRFFGEPGLRLIQETYAGAEDRAILATLRRRVSEGMPLLAAEPRLAADVQLLLLAPDTFLPCAASERH